jgi:hypothetical protein
VILFFLAAGVGFSGPVRLASADTSIELEAGPQAPQFRRIAHWENQAAERLIDHVYAGTTLQAVQWHYVPALSSANNRAVQFVYESASPGLRLFWEWEVRAGHGPIEHRIRIENLSGRELWLPLQDSFDYRFKVPGTDELKQFWVEKGAGSPSDVGVHLNTLRDGDEWTGTSSTYAHPAQGQQREMIPYSLVERGESGWYLGIEFSGRTRISVRRQGDWLSGLAGLNGDAATYKTRLEKGGSHETPTIFIGAFDGGPDGAGNVLRRWVREVLNNPVTLRNPQYPMLVSNSWGSGMAINEQQAHGMIQDASGLGLEMFHLDAGWFRSIGDWTSDPQKFPHGVGAVADFAHQSGLKFGLWTDWTQAGLNYSKMRDWLTVDPPAGWKPAEFRGITMDVGVPAVREWATKLVTGIVQDFHLDMLEHDGYLVAQGCDRLDHPHAPIDEATARRYQNDDYVWVTGNNDADVSDHAARGYYAVQSSLRKQFPALLFEICNDGGRMVDFGSAAHGDYFSITDAYDPTGNRRAFFDASYVLPPAMLETYVEKWPTKSIGNFRYMLRSGLMGWFSLMQDSNTWTAEQHAAAREEFALYKTQLRPLIRSADVYHVSERPDGKRWDGMEYFDAAVGRGVLYAFRGSAEGEDRHVYPVSGLRRERRYQVLFHDHSSPDYQATGEQILRDGITVHEGEMNCSELVFFAEL